MGVILSTSARNDVCNVVADQLDAGSSNGRLKLYDVNFSTLMAQFEFGDPAFTSAVDGTTSANTVASTSAVANGTIGRFLFDTSDGTTILSGTVSASSGGDINLTDVSVIIGDILTFNYLTMTIPTGSY